MRYDRPIFGDWENFVEKISDSTDLDQARTHNDANEIAAITVTTGPSRIVHGYNAAGNLAEAPSAKAGERTTKHKYVYDAWNRLVKVTDASDVTIARYEDDGLNRRITKQVYTGGSFVLTCGRTVLG